MSNEKILGTIWSRN